MNELLEFWQRYHQGDTDLYVCMDCGYENEWSEFPELFGYRVCPLCQSENLKEA